MGKWIGYALILIGSAGFGMAKGQELQWHLKELEIIKQVLYFTRSELQGTRSPFEEIFRKIAKKFTGKYGEWLQSLTESLKKKEEQSFEAIWKISVENYWGNSYLTKEELKELKEFGKSISYIEAINMYIDQLEYEIKITREAYQPKRRLCQSLGIMGGVFLIILLL